MESLSEIDVFQIGGKMEKIRAPFFSLWLCGMKRKYNFRWCDMAIHIGVSTQCVDSYANGRSHPQVMKYYKLCEFISIHSHQHINTIIFQSMEHIKQDIKP